jgi:hypothetical protein
LDVKRLSAVSAGVLTVAAVSTMVLGPGVATADDYAGQKYSDVTSALGDANMKGVIATRTGDSLADDDCVVTHSELAPWLKGDDFTPVTDTVLLYLNCNAGVASAKESGNSKASPEGRAAIQQAKEEAAQEQAQAAADQTKGKH